MNIRCILRPAANAYKHWKQICEKKPELWNATVNIFTLTYLTRSSLLGNLQHVLSMYPFISSQLVIPRFYIQYLSPVDRYMLKAVFLEIVCHEMVTRVVSRLLVRLRFSSNVLQIVIVVRV